MTMNILISSTELFRRNCMKSNLVAKRRKSNRTDLRIKQKKAYYTRILS